MYVLLIVIVCKKNGELCLCVDYWKLNFKIIKDVYFFFCVEELFDILCGFCYFLIMDLILGYN